MAIDDFPLDLPIVVQQGTDHYEYHEDVDDTGVISFAGWAAVMQVRDASGGTLRWEGSTADGRLICGPQDDGQGNTWQFLLWIPGADIDDPDLPAGYTGRYEVKLTDTSGRVTSYLKSTFCVEGEIVDG